jgi:hypothetical protein
MDEHARIRLREAQALREAQIAEATEHRVGAGSWLRRRRRDGAAPPATPVAAEPASTLGVV